MHGLGNVRCFSIESGRTCGIPFVVRLGVTDSVSLDRLKRNDFEFKHSHLMKQMVNFGLSMNERIEVISQVMK